MFCFSGKPRRKSGAERSRLYRERLRLGHDRETYLAKERARRKRNYLPVRVLTKSEKEERKKKNNLYMKRYRQQKKLGIQTKTCTFGDT